MKYAERDRDVKRVKESGGRVRVPIICKGVCVGGVG